MMKTDSLQSNLSGSFMMLTVVPPLPSPGSVSASLSMMDLFWNADLLIQLIMVGLLGVSVGCWTVIIQKILRIRSLKKTARQFEEAFWSGGSLDDLYDRIHTRPLDPLSTVFCVAMSEWRRSASKGPLSREGWSHLLERIEHTMALASDREMDELETHMGFLASTASASPFIGLLGTVLGIMSSFQSLVGGQQSTTLAAVAPGIAEALFATAIGLVAAIPALVAYQKFSGEIQKYSNRLDQFTREFCDIISRQREEG